MASMKQADIESQMPASLPAVVSSMAGASSSVEARRAAAISVRVSDGHDKAETEPLLTWPNGVEEEEEEEGGDVDDETTRLEQAIARAFRSTVELARHLPTGAVLVFEVLSPVFTDGGKCHDVNRATTAWLVGLSAAACFLLCFTDSFHNGKGTVRYVVATHASLWVVDGTASPPPAVTATYRLKFIDSFHVVLSLVVFLSVAMFDRNVSTCFYPVISYDVRQVFTTMPLAGGLVGVMVFATFPSTRHGIRFPVPGAGDT